MNTSTVLSILENLPAGETVGDLNATDPDSGAVLTYSLSDGNATFSIDSNGTIRSLSPLDYEQTQQISIRAKVTDEHNASIEKVFTVTVLNMDEGQAPSSGSGTTQDPYLIETLSHLNWLSHTTSARNKHFALTNDLNASETATWAQGYGFKPIASFSGSFDGRGHVIRGLTINRPNSSNVGLFASLQNAKVLNLHLSDAWLSGKVSVGMLAGSIANSTIENCSASGKLTGYKTVGGLVGFSAVRSKIRKSKSSGSVTGTNQRIGGLVGHNYTHSEITDCYSSSTVDGPNWTGGLVGLNTISSVISRCYGTGPVNKKGLVGSNHNQGIVSDSFWDIDTSGQATSSGTGATGKSTYQMKSLSTFTGAGWDVKASGGTWKMLQGSTYPLLSWEPLPIYLPSEIFFQAGILIENQPAGMLAGKVHALVSSYQYMPGMGIGNKVVIINDANHMGISFLRGEELKVTGIGSGGSVNGRTIYRPKVDKGDLWLHRGGKGSWWEAADREVSYSLIEGNGSDHNGLFSIDEDGNLRTLTPLDYESTPSLRLRVRVNKENLASIEKALTITLWDDPNENFVEVVQSDGQSPGSQANPMSGNPSVDSNGNDQTVSNQPNPPQQVIAQTPVYEVPSVSTQVARKTSDGRWRFEAKVLTSGNFPIFERGFQVSPKISFQTFLRLPVSIDSNKTHFSTTSLVSQFLPDRVHYYRAYARSAVGANFGPIRKFIPNAEAPKAWWAQMPAIGAGWHNSEWFGTFRPYDNDWIYHAKLGWAYAATDGKQGLWLWTEGNGWLWTQPGVYPYLWKHRTGNWLYLLGTRNGNPVFFDLVTNSVR